MKFQNHEVEIIRWVGRNVEIKRVDGGTFSIKSQLRYHEGRPPVAVDTWITSPQNIEGFVK